jgi:hypothetical protein
MEFLSLLLSKEVLKVLLPIAGVLGAGFLVYFKGRSDANKKHQLERAEAERELNKDIRTAEKDNKVIKIRRNENVKKLRDARTIVDIIKLFREKFSRKT